MSNRALSRTIWAIIIVVILVVAMVGAVYSYIATRPTKQISITATTLEASEGTAITFTILNLASDGKATLYFGDGQSATGLTSSSSSSPHTYENPGTYLVTAEETVSGSTISTNNAMKTITIEPTVSSTLAPLISEPVIALNATTNPGEPVVTANTPVIFSGGYLFPPSSSDVTILGYIWDFGNGVNDSEVANSATLDPNVNPVNATYTQTGLYPVSLTLVTENSVSLQTYSTTVERTVAVSSAAHPYAVYVYAGKIASPGVINVAEVVGGGPASFDPQCDYETVGYEVILNTIGSLLIYDGSSTTTFLPMIAASVPTVGNGINSAETQYTFTIRNNLKFSNGAPITAYDVYYSMIRNLLFIGGTQGTPDWILAQYIVAGASAGIPIVANATDTADYNAIMKAVTYSNSANTVTFNLVSPTAPSLFFTAVAFDLGCGILSASWLQSVGAGITFTPAGFYSYQSQANENDFNTNVQFSPIASGPYEIESYVPGQSVVLAPNPGFPGLPGIPAVSNKISIQWIKDPETAYLLYTSGAADIVTGLPTSDFPLIKNQVAAGTSSLYKVPSLSCFFYAFNINIDTSLMKSTFGSSFNVPATYFANTLVREAFTDAFNYTNYLNEILGNSIYGEDFGSAYAGAIINGLPYYVPESQLANVSAYDLSTATQLMKQSGEYGVSVNIPISVVTGDTTNYAGAEMWGAALHQMDPNIAVTVEYQEWPTIIADQAPGANPMPVYYLGWIADYPYPSDFINAFYLQSSIYPDAMGFSASGLTAAGYPAEAAQFKQLQTVIQQANAATNPTTAAQLYKQAEQDAINLYMFTYVVQSNSFWVVKPYMSGYNGIQSEENAEIGGGADSIYYWWIKG